MWTPPGARTGGNYRSNTTTFSLLSQKPEQRTGPRTTTGPRSGTGTDPKSISALVFDAIVGVASCIDGTLFVLHIGSQMWFWCIATVFRYMITCINFLKYIQLHPPFCIQFYSLSLSHSPFLSSIYVCIIYLSFLHFLRFSPSLLSFVDYLALPYS